MAAQAGFSKFYFARAFKDAYGETPANHLIRGRVERARGPVASIGGLTPAAQYITIRLCQ
jgi:AraC-like DNA-binding protein